MDNTKDMCIEVDGKSFILKAINAKMLDAADRVEKIAFSKALRDEALTVDEAQKIIKERGFITEKDENDYAENVEGLNKKIVEIEDTKLSDKKRTELYNEITEIRNKMVEHNLKMQPIFDSTAETIARNEADIFLVYNVLCNEKCEPIYSSPDELRDALADSTVLKVFEEAHYFVRNFDKDFEKQFPENISMAKNGFIIDENGNVKKEVEKVTKRGRKKKADEIVSEK